MSTQEPSASLIEIRRRAESDRERAAPAEARLTANWDLRQRSRFRTRLDDGREVAVLLPRGGVLRAGDRLVGECGLQVEVCSARENLMVAETSDANLFARACYHMGNRHVPLQVEANRLAFQPDHVLGAMLEALGLVLSQREAPFDPEAGAYAGGHSHSDSHSDSHPHSHPHSPPHSHSHPHSHPPPHSDANSDANSDADSGADSGVDPGSPAAETPARGPRIHRTSASGLDREPEGSSHG